MKRRVFLQSAAAAAGLSGLPLFRPAVAGEGRVAFAVVTGIDENTAVGPLITLLDAFAKRYIPVTCALNPFGKNGDVLSSGHPVLQMLAAYLLSNRGLEIAVSVPRLAAKSGYFQARAAEQSQAALKGVFQSTQAGRRFPTSIRTLVCETVPNPRPPEGLRSAGIQSVLTIPAASGEVLSETWPDGTVRLSGGARVALGSTLPEAAGVSPPPQSLFYVEARSLQGFSEAGLEAAAESFADHLVGQEIAGRFSLPPLSDLQLRDYYGYRRKAAILLNGPDNDERLSEFETDLKEAQLPFLRVNVPEEELLSGRAGFWLETETPDRAMVPVSVAWNLKQTAPVVTSARQRGAGVGIVFAAAEDPRTGIDGQGFLHLPALQVRVPNAGRDQIEGFSQSKDIVFVIQPDLLDHQLARRDLLRALSDLNSRGVTRFEALEDMARSLVTHGVYDVRHRRTEAAMPAIRQPPDTALTADRGKLLEDARTAWRFFERYTHPQTGLCPASINFTPGGGNVHAAVTMWDVGSQINALIAAAKLEFITLSQFRNAARKLLPQIRGRESQGRLLPQGWIRTERHKWGNKNFDGCDAGRLMAALDCLRRFDPELEGELQATVSKWDLEKVILNKEIFSVTDGTLETTYISHCAHYSALAFRRWGLNVRSPYEVFSGRSANDGQMALLEAAAAIGPFGAEPLLLEAMEFGMSPESAYLANVLFAAQLEEFQDTGEIVCVSEGPIDRPPWFTYQGLLLDRKERTWAIDTVGEELQYRNTQFWKDNRVFSTKAAFLWAAYQPHDLSDRMLEKARDLGRTKNGFASSIYSKTGRATEFYTDINTNAVILQAISSMIASGS